MKKKLLRLTTFGLFLVSAIVILTSSSFNKTGMLPLDAVYYYRVTINNEVDIPSNATGYVKVSDSDGGIWQVPYVHGQSVYNIKAGWNYSTITACPSLVLNVNVYTQPTPCGTFSNPLNFCIGSLRIIVGGDEN